MRVIAENWPTVSFFAILAIVIWIAGMREKSRDRESQRKANQKKRK